VASTATAAELSRAAYLRADELEEIVRNLRGPLGASRGSLQNALALAGDVPGALRDVVKNELAKTSDPDLQVQILLPLLRHTNFVLDFVEQHLSHGTRRELSEALADEIRGELSALSLADHEVVLSHGAADNFETVFGDLSGRFFGPLALPGSASPASVNFALFKVPRLEGAGVQWRPVLLGHEVAHVAAVSKGAVAAFDLRSKFDLKIAASLPNPKAPVGLPATTTALRLFRIAEAWTTELICDLHALHRFGPAAIAALTEYFMCIGAMDTSSSTHPPGLLRIRLLLDHLGAVGDTRLAAIVAPWADEVPPNVILPEPWAQYLADLFTANLQPLAATLTALATPQYDHANRTSRIHETADRISEGLLGRDVMATGASIEILERADVANAVWLARVEGAPSPIDRLAQKTLESIDFVASWMDAGGPIPVELHQPTSDVSGVLAAEHGVAILSEDSLLNRMRLDDANKGLGVAPALHTPKGTGLDLRLGTRFIVFKRTGTAAFDPLDEGDDPRAVQVFVEVSRRERFVLHPQEVVLGATLEYLSIPDDLSGQVITRSSYGRLGLLSATAVQIHPGFRGCLTLELVNLSTIPITLTPGERVAQLVLWKSSTVGSTVEKYTYPIGPEFSRVRSDSEAITLRTLRG